MESDTITKVMNASAIKKGLWEFRTYPAMVSSNYGGSRFLWMFDMLWALLKYGARPVDYYRFDFFKLNRHERNRYLTFYKYMKIAKQLVREGAIMGDKVKEYQKYKSFIKRSWIFAPESTDEEIQTFVDNNGEVIAKPNGGEQGKGVIVLKKSDLKKELYGSLRDNNYLIEEKLVNCPELSAINSSSLNTLRVYTMLDKSGTCNILSIMLRVGRPGSEVDNWGAGGIGYNIDLETGTIVGYGIDKKGGKHVFHPGTQKVMPGFKIPNYNGLLRFIKDISSIDKKARFVGWDIAITPDGFDLIEMNCPAGHDFLQTFGKPYGKRLKELW